MTGVCYNLGFVAFNNPDDLKAMISSLKKWNPSGLTNCLLVDHSTEDAARLANYNMATEAGWKYFAQPNLGFGAGVNRLVSMSQGVAVLVVLNLDVSFRKIPPFLMMAEAIMMGKFALVGTSMVNEQGKRVAGRLPALNLRMLFHDFQKDLDEDSSVALSWQEALVWDGAVHGGCFALCIKDFLQVGGIDEDLFLYAEEFDLYTKFHRKQMPIGFLVSSEIVHASEGKADRMKQFLNRYNLRYLAKRERKWVLTFAFTVFLLLDFVRFSRKLKVKPLLSSNMSRSSLLKELF
jgi:GT2 family glycosyltransferase